MNLRILIAIICLYVTPLWAADPFWQHGKTDDRYEITVYRNASCNCCKGWINHLREHHFNVEDIIVNDVNKYKLQYDVPPQAASCHTAVTNGVIIEGHVPAQDIKRLLADDRDDIRLLTVPAMPSGTPGMDTPGAPKDSFRVFAIDKKDQVEVFNSYENY